MYDGWETRRRREPGPRLGDRPPGAGWVVRGVVVDTAYFKGTTCPRCRSRGPRAEGYLLTAGELQQAEWVPLVPRSPAKGDALNRFDVDVPWRFTHVRLCMYPDGGVARLRCTARACPTPATWPPVPSTWLPWSTAAR